ncbi:MAG: hypothetical protein B7Z60_04785 [Ferrovum sp. 37-45-19]|nr:MAG: hypothetical protein B7Z65_02560 [Ferrovum sp. 21-44-67]OYV94501.1 MAG: hypothetical protein B7Z60_04785 [Ferrovum sp. 37-45-19]OZB33879.1 MAG: hypothetical protein B7X47_02630 [Ferrovum sp. 34-44-207]HQT81600.1 cobalamin biosynthesis protein [Ferrovaceae bacterium]HQU06489.1 cobalamin biosynthesis protein [Ferrovaceae bacterium]
MNLFLILISLFSEKYRPSQLQSRLFTYFTQYLHYLDDLFNSGERHHGVVAWFVGILPPLFAFYLINRLLVHLGIEISWLINLLVLGSVIQFRTLLKQLSEATDDIRLKMRESQDMADHESFVLMKSQAVAHAIEVTINEAHTFLFAILFWYGLLPGVYGVLLYMLALYINRYWGQDRQTDFGYFSRRMFYFLNWPVYYLTALTFAVVGNFEDALFCWRTQGIKEGESTTSRIFFASAAGALGIRLGDLQSSQRSINGLDLGLGEAPDFDHLKSTEGLIWRALMVWLIVYALMTLAAHV